MKLSLWPTPFYYQFEEDLATFDSEPCQLVGNDNHDLFGDLTEFAPEQGVFEIKPLTGEIAKLQPEAINQLRLLHAVHLVKKPALPHAHNHEIFSPSDKQSCAILFTNGKILETETVGYAMDKTGLYLFLVHTDDTVIRCFIPSGSIKHYEIGKKIGQMLVEEKIATHQEITTGLEKQSQQRNQKLGEYLTKEQIVTPEQLEAALKHQTGSVLKLGDVLVQEKLITEEMLHQALTMQRTHRKQALGEILIEMGVVDTEVIQSMLAKKLGIPFVNATKFRIDPQTFGLVSIRFIEKYSILPLYRTNNTLVVAMENPLVWEPLNELRVITSLNVVPVLASRDAILRVIKELSRANEITGKQKIGDLARTMNMDVVDDAPEDSIAETDNTLVGVVNKMILDAYNQGVSDIHLETYPGKRNTLVRFRKDGVMKKYFEFPPKFRSALVSRIKIMARLDISEKRRPQDGKIEIKLSADNKLELRVATVPTAHGLEDVVMRVLACAQPVALDKVGLPANVLERIKVLAQKPYGLFLLCGPTGSGKTTTLHSVLSFINSPERKIWTAEDPIEITQDGLRQVQVNANIGWTFAAAMRSFLRADPDVIMVGEMRDIETAQIAIQASLTGHMVFSTLHTNSAAESMVRLLDLGMDPFNFSDALVGILAQRLTRRYCKSCKTSYIPSRDELLSLVEEYCAGTPLDSAAVMQAWHQTYRNQDGGFTLYAAGGCELCEGTGYKGRMGVYEFLEATPPIKSLIQHQASVVELQATAIKQGMRTLKQSGIELVLQGHTNIEQIRSVCN